MNPLLLPSLFFSFFPSSFIPITCTCYLSLLLFWCNKEEGGDRWVRFNNVLSFIIHHININGHCCRRFITHILLLTTSNTLSLFFLSPNWVCAFHQYIGCWKLSYFVLWCSFCLRPVGLHANGFTTWKMQKNSLKVLCCNLAVNTLASKSTLLGFRYFRKR